MQWRKRGEKGKQWKLDNKLDPDSEPGTNGVILLLSFGCQQIRDRYKQGRNREEKKVQEHKTATDFFSFGGGWGVGSLIHVTLHLRLAASSTCFKTTNPFASRGSGRLCPFMWTDSVRCVCIMCLSALGLSCSHKRTHEKPQWSRDWLIWLTNSSSALPISRGNFRYKDVALTMASNQMELLPPLAFCLHLWTPFSGTEYLPWVIN